MVSNGKMRVALTLAMLCAAFAPQMVRGTDLRWCAVEGKATDGVTELKKCEDMVELLNDLTDSLNNNLHWSCVERSDCHNAALQAGNAELVSLDGGDLFATSRLWDAIPVLAEDYNEQDSGTGGTEYHTVVAMKASQCTETTTLASLKGKKACSTGYRKTAGWRMPIGLLLKRRVMDEVDNECDANNDAESAAAFFSGMCSPGAGDSSVVGDNTALGDKLCSACKSGQDSDFCVAGADAYSGYDGALTCMTEGSGDVAFIKHTTMADHDWSNGDTMNDYKLLCPQGGCQGVDEWATCKWATVPAHAVVVNPTRVGRSTQVLIRQAFEEVQKSAAFKGMFLMDAGTNNNAGDLVFKGSTYRLRGIDNDMLGFMGEAYDVYAELASIETSACAQEAIQNMVEDAASGDGGIPSWGVAVIVVISLVCAGMLALILVMWRSERRGKPLFQPLVMDNPLSNNVRGAMNA